MWRVHCNAYCVGGTGGSTVVTMSVSTVIRVDVFSSLSFSFSLSLFFSFYLSLSLCLTYPSPSHIINSIMYVRTRGRRGETSVLFGQRFRRLRARSARPTTRTVYDTSRNCCSRQMIIITIIIHLIPAAWFSMHLLLTLVLCVSACEMYNITQR